MSATQSNPNSNELPPKLSKPALRALNNAGIYNLDQLSKVSEAELKKLHGMGPNGIKVIKQAIINYKQ